MRRIVFYLGATMALLVLIALFLIPIADREVDETEAVKEDGKKAAEALPEINVIRGLSLIKSGTKGYTFDAVAVNHSGGAVDFIIYNAGLGDLRISGVHLMGEDADQFRMDTGGMSSELGPDEYTVFIIAFTPTMMGAKTAKVTVKSNDPDEGEYVFDVTGTAVAAARPEEVRAFAENGRITITWSKVRGADSYNIYWSNSPGVTRESGTGTAGVASPYVHSNLTNGVSYYYMVTAENAYGESMESEEVSARPGKTYYVDASGGDDENDGLSPKTAWKTVEKVNSMSFQPGEYVLFKRGETWQGMLRVPSSGAPGSPVTFGAYGDGEMPIITGKGAVPGWSVASNWTGYSENIWYIYYGPYKIGNRLWLSGKEYVKAQNLRDVDETYRWYFDYETSLLYVYAEENPAIHYSNIEESMAAEPVGIQILGKDHVIIRELDIRGGRDAIDILGSDHITIEDCRIGLDTGHIGVWVSGWGGVKNNSDYGVIRRCAIDSGYSLSYYYEKAQTEDGIHMRDSANHWEIYENEIRNWGHNSISFAQFDDTATVSYNKVYSNLMTAPDISYGRGIGIVGEEGKLQYNEFYYNVIKDTTVPNQIGGDHNSFYYNVIDTVKNTEVYPENFSPGIVLTPAMSGKPGYVSNYNKIYNNVIYNTDGAGIMVEGWPRGYSIKHNEIRNNIILDCGNNSTYWDRNNIGLYIYPLGWDDTLTATDNIFQNNLIYKAGVAGVVSYNGTAMSVAEFNGRSGSFGDNIGGNIQEDPRLLDPGNREFALQYLSPAIDAGVYVGLKRDIAGIPVPQGAEVDIGAYEYH